jgi:hypothetical protein
MPPQQLLQYLSRSRKPDAGKALRESKSEATGAEPTPTQRHWPDRLELQAAVNFHLEWCVLFNDHLSVDEQHTDQLAPLPSADDSDLGRWLHHMRQGLAPGDNRCDALHEEHHRFHQLAGRALALARQDRMDLASTLLNTAFERSRVRVLELLRQLQQPGA